MQTIMITAYYTNKRQPEIVHPENPEPLQEAVWVDLLCPSIEEEHLLEDFLKINIPTREEMQEIELSSRLYKNKETLFMTATLIERSHTMDPKSDAVTFILIENRLISVRYIEPQSFKVFISRLASMTLENYYAINFMVGLLDATVDRLADILEHIGHRIDNFSQTIFRNQIAEHGSLDYKKMLQEIGINGDLNTKAQESLITLNRLIRFFSRNLPVKDREACKNLSILLEDIKSLNNYETFLSNKVTFLLDATLGMVNIEQNNIIKIFSIAAVILLPPTLVASIYGMNFKFIPELSWYFGYPFAIVCMIISAWLPYQYFKKRNWL